MRRLFFLIVSVSLAVPAISQSKHPFTFEDMISVPAVTTELNGSELWSPTCGSLPATAICISFPIDILYVDQYDSYRIPIGDSSCRLNRQPFCKGPWTC